MSNSPEEGTRYALLEALLEVKGLKLKGIYTIRDAAQIFGTSVRTIQDWVRDGKLVARELPGRGRFLSEDLDRFLRESVRKREDTVGQSAPVPQRVPRRIGVPIERRKASPNV
jgi:excisionase family DNA binding protein